MFRLVFLIAMMAYIGFTSLFVETSHTIVEERHIFAYNGLALVLGIGFNGIPLAAAWYLGRVKKDRGGVVIMLLFIPAFVFLILPQYFLERVEISPTQIIHRREPPHTRYNATIAFSEIVSAVELDYETGKRGYTLRLKEGREIELPANTVLTAAAETLTRELHAHKIPLTTKAIRTPEE